MPTVNFYRLLQRALICVAALLGAAGAARADLVTGVWDPFFGTPFTNLGYRGNVVFDVPAACFLSPNGQVLNTDPCSNGAMTTAGITVQFYDGGNVVQPTLETLAFDPLTLAINYVDIDDGDVIGLGTGYTPWVAATTLFESASSYFFSVYFGGDFVQMVWKPSGSGDTVEQAVAAGQLSNPAQVRFTRQTNTGVPEPASLALVAAALAAAGMATRRRRR